MNKEYFNKNEERDYQLMSDLNSKLSLTDFGKAPEKHHFDASGITSTGDKVGIEIKYRNQNYTNGKLSGTTYTADTMMIEAHKAASLLFDFTMTNTIPLYVNFTNDGNIAIVYNLTKLKNIPKKKNYYNIQSKGYERTENGDRFLLPLDEAFIYKRENNMWVRITNNGG